MAGVLFIHSFILFSPSSTHLTHTHAFSNIAQACPGSVQADTSLNSFHFAPSRRSIQVEIILRQVSISEHSSKRISSCSTRSIFFSTVINISFSPCHQRRRRRRCHEFHQRGRQKSIFHSCEHLLSPFPSSRSWVEKIVVSPSLFVLSCLLCPCCSSLSLIEAAAVRARKISSRLFNHYHAWCAKRRRRRKKKKRERERVVGSPLIFFVFSANGNALFRMSELFLSPRALFFLPLPLSIFLALIFSLSRLLTLSLVHSRGFSERDNWVRWKRSFHSIFFFHTHTHTHRHLARNGWYTLCIVWFALNYKHQVISASVGGALPRSRLSVSLSLCLLSDRWSSNRRCLWRCFDHQGAFVAVSQHWSVVSQWPAEQHRLGFVSIGLVAVSLFTSSDWSGVRCLGQRIRQQFGWIGTWLTSCQCGQCSIGSRVGTTISERKKEWKGISFSSLDSNRHERNWSMNERSPPTRRSTRKVNWPTYARGKKRKKQKCPTLTLVTSFFFCSAWAMQNFAFRWNDTSRARYWSMNTNATFVVSAMTSSSLKDGHALVRSRPFSGRRDSALKIVRSSMNSV